MNGTPKILKIEMSRFGKALSHRVDAQVAIEEILKSHDLRSFDKVLVDFNGVETISSGYAFDFFNRMREIIGENFLKHISVSFKSELDNPLVKVVVRGAIGAATKKPNI